MWQLSNAAPQPENVIPPVKQGGGEGNAFNQQGLGKWSGFMHGANYREIRTGNL